MEHTKELRFECIHCGNCCDNPNTLVNTTYLDILRIKEGLNFSVEEMLEVLGFYIYTENLSSDNLSKMVVPPIYTENGLSFVALRKLNSGMCFFYNQKKRRCSIYSIRPNFCRTFPFFFYYSSKEHPILHVNYTEKGLEYCKGISDKSPLIDFKYWLELGKKVIQDLIKNENFTKKWNKSIKHQKIKVSAKNYLLEVFKEEYKEKK